MAAVPPQPPNPHIPIARQHYAPNYPQTIFYNYLGQARNQIAVEGQALGINPRISNGYYLAFQQLFSEAVVGVDSAMTVKDIYISILNDVLEQLHQSGNSNYNYRR